MTKDVERSSIRFAIFVDRDNLGPMQMDFYYLTDSEDEFGHVGLKEDGWYSSTIPAGPDDSQSSSYSASMYS